MFCPAHSHQNMQVFLHDPRLLLYSFNLLNSRYESDNFGTQRRAVARGGGLSPPFGLGGPPWETNFYV